MPKLPHGTVTLVFTDVEGSTQLVHKLGQRYEKVLADHGRLLREAVADGDGQVVDHRGDEFFVVFAEARRAAQAVVAAQQDGVVCKHYTHAAEPSSCGAERGEASREPGRIELVQPFRLVDAG